MKRTSVSALKIEAETGQLPRYRSAPDRAPRLALQERDIKLLEDVWHYRCLTTSQIEMLRSVDKDASLRFVSRLPLTRRLKLLFHHRYVARLARPLASGSMEPAYVLDREGARVLSTLHGEVRAKALSQHPKASALEHLLAIANIRVALTAACERRPGVELIEWRGSEEAKFTVSAPPAGGKVHHPKALIPDGFALVSTSEHHLFFFVEIDLGTEPAATLIKKMLAYYEYWRSGGFATKYAVPPRLGFRVLVVVPSKRRMESVLHAMRSLNQGRGMILVTTQDCVTPASIFDPFWVRADDAQSSTLLT